MHRPPWKAAVADGKVVGAGIAGVVAVAVAVAAAAKDASYLILDGAGGDGFVVGVEIKADQIPSMTDNPAAVVSAVVVLGNGHVAAVLEIR